MSSALEAAQERLRSEGKRDYNWGVPFNRFKNSEWRKGWIEAQQAHRRERAAKASRLSSLLDEAEHKAMLQRAEMLKRGAGGRWTVLGR